MSKPVNRGSAKGRTYRLWSMTVCTLPTFKANVITRQQRRAHKRAVAFQGISEQFGGELRRIRRAMAFVLAKRKGAQP